MRDAFLAAIAGLDGGKPWLLDLFCCEGGAAAGYEAAGFEVVGVDIIPQPRYRHPMVVVDALSLTADILRLFDAVHASPVCKGYSVLRFSPNTKPHPLLIPPTRTLLKASGLPYVIENVSQARWDMIDPLQLCGSQFGLGAVAGGAFHQLRRERLFECSFPVPQPACRHTQPVIGIYGGHARNRSAAHGGRGTADFVGENRPALARQAMGIDWMTMQGLSEALPPAFTRYIGEHLRAVIQPEQRQRAVA